MMTIIKSETYWDEEGQEHLRVTLDFDRAEAGQGPELEQAAIFNVQAEIAKQMEAFQRRMFGPANEYALFKMPV